MLIAVRFTHRCTFSNDVRLSTLIAIVICVLDEYSIVHTSTSKYKIPRTDQSAHEAMSSVEHIIRGLNFSIWLPMNLL